MTKPQARRIKSFKQFINEQTVANCNNEAVTRKPFVPTNLNGGSGDVNLIKNEMLSFRCPNVLRERLEEYGYDHDMGMSEVIRLGCATLIRNNLPTRSADEAPSQSITMDANGQFGTKAAALTRKT